MITGTAGWKTEQVKSVELLGSEAKVVWEMTPEGLQISPPADLGASTIAWSFKIATDRQQHVPNAIERNVDKVFKGTKKVELDGKAK